MGFLDSLKRSQFVQGIKSFLQKIILPGMNGISLYQLIRVYVEGIRELELGNRASAISWRLFLGLFPFIMFFLLFIQYLPYFNVLEDYFYNDILGKILPKNIIDSTWQYLSDRQQTINSEYKNSGFFTIIIGVIVFLVSSTIGINSLIKGLNFSDDDNSYDRNRNGLRQFSTALYLNIFLTFLLIVGLLTLYYIDVIAAIMVRQNLHFVENPNLLKWIRYGIFALIYFSGIFAIYYIGPKRKLTFRQILPGAIFTTILFLLDTAIFGVYISNMTRYNILYGSLGTVLIIMISLYINVMLIIIGYQLNLSILESKYLHQNESDTAHN